MGKPVSKTKLPPLGEYTQYLKHIWKNNWLTNNGELVQELECNLKDYWKVKHVICVSSGTSAIQIALKALGIKEVYTSPYSFIATVAAPLWLGIRVKFLDLDENYYGSSLSTHVYGIPHLVAGNPVIYDASHAFAVKVNGHSIMNEGDISCVSFHAVKIFQTVEGGAIVTNSDDLAEKARWMRNYGLKDRYTVMGAGMNAKMSEFHAAMGLCSLKGIDKRVKKYAKLIDRYNQKLGHDHKDVTYYPIYYSSENKVLKAIKKFEKYDIYPRRYFYPPLNQIFSKTKCPIAEQRMKTVLCLPLYYDLTQKDQNQIIKIAQETL